MIPFTLFTAVFIGAGIVFLLPIRANRIQILLSFSGAYLLSITILHLLPEIYHEDKTTAGFFILLGILVQSVLEVISQGAEHGHIHRHSDGRFPWLLFIGLSIHAFFEGMPTAHHGSDALLKGILIHKIPIAMVLASFVRESGYSSKQSLLFVLGFALMSPIGYLVSESIDLNAVNVNYLDAFISGILLHVSTIILFESTENHRFNQVKFISILLGFALAFWA